MFNRKLKKRIKELEQDNERLKGLLRNSKVVMPEGVKNSEYMNLIVRIIEKTKYAEYQPFQEELLSFIVSELIILNNQPA